MKDRLLSLVSFGVCLFVRRAFRLTGDFRRDLCEEASSPSLAFPATLCRTINRFQSPPELCAACIFRFLRFNKRSWYGFCGEKSLMSSLIYVARPQLMVSMSVLNLVPTAENSYSCRVVSLMVFAR